MADKTPNVLSSPARGRDLIDPIEEMTEKMLRNSFPLMLQIFVECFITCNVGLSGETEYYKHIYATGTGVVRVVNWHWRIRLENHSME